MLFAKAPSKRIQITTRPDKLEKSPSELRLLRVTNLLKWFVQSIIIKNSRKKIRSEKTRKEENSVGNEENMK